MAEIPLVLKCPRNNKQSTKENYDQGQQRLKKKKICRGFEKSFSR